MEAQGWRGEKHMEFDVGCTSLWHEVHALGLHPMMMIPTALPSLQSQTFAICVETLSFYYYKKGYIVKDTHCRLSISST